MWIFLSVLLPPAMYAPSTVKRQKIVREPAKVTESFENFQGVGKIEYKPDASHTTDDNLYYKFYNAAERVHGRSLEDWLRPSVFLGRCFTPYPSCIQRPWCETAQTVENYKKSVRAMFELCLKLGLKFWSGYDRDMAPEGGTFEETQNNFEQVVDLILEYQQKTGIRPLWIGVDFKNHNRYKNGACTNSDPYIVTHAGFQVKRALDIALKLNSDCFLFTTEQEGYENILNTDLKKEFKFYSRFMKMIIDQRDKIGYRGQLLIQTVYEQEPDVPKYNTTLFSTLTFLKHYNYDHYFKVNVRPGHDFHMSNVYGSMGSVDIKKTDLHDAPQATLLLKTLIENGGFGSGGLTLYVPQHNGPFEAKDLMEAFITTLDTYAKALRVAVKLVNDSQINKNIQTRYMNFTTGWGAKLMASDMAFEDCEEYLKKNSTLNSPASSSRSDHWSSILSRYIDAPLK